MIQWEKVKWVYAWMGCVQVLSPSEQMMRDLAPLLTAACEKAVISFARSVSK